MRTRRTQAPHTSRPRAARMRSLVAALLAAPLALGTLAATALPAAAEVENSIAGEAPESSPEATTTDSSAPVAPQEGSGAPAETSATDTSTDSDSGSPAGDPGTGSAPTDENPATGTTQSDENPPTGTTPSDENPPSTPTTPVTPVIPPLPQPPLPVPPIPSTPDPDVSPIPAAQATKTTVSASSQAIGPWQQFTLTATVRTTDGTPVTEGQILFAFDGVKETTLVSLSPLGTATMPVWGKPAGQYKIAATFIGTSHFASSSSEGQSVSIKDFPSVKLSIPATITTETVDFSVSVAAPMHVTAADISTFARSWSPTGAVTVTFSKDGKVVTTHTSDLVTVPETDTAIVNFTAPTPPPGTYTVTASYHGDELFRAGKAVSTTTVPGTTPPVTPPVTPVTPVTPVITVPETITTTVGTAATLTIGLPAENRPSFVRITGPSFSFDGPTSASSDIKLTLPVLDPGTHEVVVQTAASKTLSGTEHTVRVIVTGEPAKGSTTPNADLTGSTTTLVTGKKITLVARDFLPGETVAFYLHSDPVFLGTAVADQNGVATLVVALPAGVPAGAHHVQATGGTSGRWAEIPVTVTEGTPAVETPVETGPIVTVPVAAPVAPAAPAAVTPAAAAPAAPAAVTAAPLAATGAELGSTALLVSVLLGSGALLLAGRRRLTTSAR